MAENEQPRCEACQLCTLAPSRNTLSTSIRCHAQHQLHSGTCSARYCTALSTRPSAAAIVFVFVVCLHAAPANNTLPRFPCPNVIPLQCTPLIASLHPMLSIPPTTARLSAASRLECKKTLYSSRAWPRKRPGAAAAHHTILMCIFPNHTGCPRATSDWPHCTLFDNLQDHHGLEAGRVTGTRPHGRPILDALGPLPYPLTSVQ